MRSKILLLSLLLLAACQPAPEPIRYGSDMCHFCKMTIVDRQHAAELVSTKGKAMKFDAIECMLRFQQEQPSLSYAFQLVNDFEKPGTLIDAQTSFFLISPAIPSPMGANLSAFEDQLAAERFAKEKGGQVYAWSALVQHTRQSGLIPQN